MLLIIIIIPGILDMEDTALKYAVCDVCCFVEFRTWVCSYSKIWFHKPLMLIIVQSSNIDIALSVLRSSTNYKKLQKICLTCYLCSCCRGVTESNQNEDSCLEHCDKESHCCHKDYHHGKDWHCDKESHCCHKDYHHGKDWHCDKESHCCHKDYHHGKNWHCDKESHFCTKVYHHSKDHHWHCDKESHFCPKDYHYGKDYHWHCDTNNADSDSPVINLQELTIKHQKKEMIEKQGGIMANTTEEKQLNHELCIGEKLLVRKKCRKKVCDVKYKIYKFSILQQSFWFNFAESKIVGCQKWDESNALNKRAAWEILRNKKMQCNNFDKKIEGADLLICENNSKNVDRERDISLQVASKEKIELNCNDGTNQDLSTQDGLTRKCVVDGGTNQDLSSLDGLTRKCEIDDGTNQDLSSLDGLTRKCEIDDGTNQDLSSLDGLTRKCEIDDGTNQDLSSLDGLTRKFKANDWTKQDFSTRKCKTNDGTNQDLSSQHCSTMKYNKSKDPSTVKVSFPDLYRLKNLENVDFTSSLLEEGNISLNVLRDLGLNHKFSFNEHIFWQEITVYPLTQNDPEVTTSQGNPHNLMHYEVFRLCSFSYTRFPANFDVWVTQLAQAGFYCVDQNGKIVCFDCGQEFRGTVNTPIENAHRSGCCRHQHSRPLHMWTQGLNREVLAIYYNRYGSLRPYNFEASSNAGNNLEHSDHAQEARGRSEFTILDPQSQQNNDCTSVGPSLGRGSDVAETRPDGDESSFRDEMRPEYHSEAMPIVQMGTSRDYPFGRQRHSLPSNLNVVSGAVVSEESQDMSGSHNVLTSAARDPVSVHNVPFRGDDSQDGQSGRENGAVGGADPTFDLSKASYPLFSSSTARRQTFTTWSSAHSHQPDDLVAAGFFYAGYADCVRCFYCGLGLKFWRDTDIPAYQHARYRPHCVYNRLYKGQDYIDRVQQDILNEQGSTNQATNQVTLPPAAQDEAAPTTVAPAPTTVAPAPTLADTDISSVIRVTSSTAELPQINVLMDSPVAQAALLNGWQRNQVQRAVEHIVRELGENCLEIGILLDVLMNLYTDHHENNLLSGNSTDSSDSGITENTLTPSALASVRVPARENSSVSGAGQRAGVVDLAQAKTTPAAVAQPSEPSRVELFRSVEREHTLLSERVTCRVCRLRPVCCIYLPCGHVIACQECADRATHCLFCGKQIVGTASVFLA